MRGSEGEDVKLSLWATASDVFSKPALRPHSSKRRKDACLITLNALNAAVSSVSSYIRLIKITIEKTTVGCDAGEARSIETYRSSLTMLFFFLNFQSHFLKASSRNRKKCQRVTLARLTLEL